ncbi:MAG: helix-turn-helix domain-containing protein [Planctomycetia bacterium]|nr:helix-turn-helix domain-containing protein [Planctomycetia bacterium]
MSSAPSPAKALLKVTEVAEILSMGVRTVWRKVATGELPQPVRFNKSLVRWKYESIKHYLDNLQ